MSGAARRNRNSCGSSGQQYVPYMFGSRRYETPRAPSTVCVNRSTPTLPPPRTTSFHDPTTSVRDCLYWPASLNGTRMSQPSSYPPANYIPQPASGDFQFCAAPPKAYISAPGKRGIPQSQNIPCQVAPLGTDPMSMIKPLAPLCVRVQAPSDLFTGDPSEPKTISISPAQLYGS